MKKLTTQFDGETRFDQPIWCITRTWVQRSPSHPGSVAHAGHGRTAEADQVRIDLWNLFDGL